MQITHHTGFATFVPIFHEICSTYSFTAVHLLKRIFGTNILEICIHISVLCRCIHTKGYWMHTYTKYAPIYPPLRMYSYEVCLEQTYSKYAHTYTNCVLYRIIEHQVQMSLAVHIGVITKISGQHNHQLDYVALFVKNKMDTIIQQNIITNTQPRDVYKFTYSGQCSWQSWSFLSTRY